METMRTGLMTTQYWFLNGQSRLIDKDEISFDDICELTYGKRGIHPTVIFHRAAQEKSDGHLMPGQSLRLGSGTIINCVFTNYA